MAEKSGNNNGARFRWVVRGAWLLAAVANVTWIIINLHSYPNAKGVVLEAVMKERFDAVARELKDLKVDVQTLVRRYDPRDYVR